MFEQSFITKYSKFIIGCDEVGRGCIAGPVVCCSVMLKSEKLLDDLRTATKGLERLKINDSKKISAHKRKTILNILNIDLNKINSGKFNKIIFDKKIHLSFVISEISNTYIDETNILYASLLGMNQSYGSHWGIKSKKGTVLIDGHKGFDFYEGMYMNRLHDYHSIKKGDEKSLLIGLASIIAKEYRDKLMSELPNEFKKYHFSNNSGYPTKCHKNALIKFGVSSIHRKSFAPVKQLLHE